MSQALHIFISPETLFTVGGYGVSNTLFTSLVVTTIFVFFALYATTQIKSTAKPRGLQNLLEMLIDLVTGIVEGVTGKSKIGDAVFPLISAFLIFIMINNLVALLPGFHTIKYTGKPTLEIANVPNWLRVPTAFASTAQVKADPAAHGETAVEPEAAATHEVAAAHAEKAVDIFRGANADLSLTLALAAISVAATQYFGLKFVHLSYLKKYFNFKDPIGAFVGFLELFLEFSKVMSFGFRLFGNIFAGEVLISVIKFLVPVLLPIPFLGIEVFVGCLQSYVFAMLSLVFFQMAAMSTHE
jgi:F-type H+-transporting ATPase subunit a